MNSFGIKELYSVTLKPTLDMEINGVQYQENEPIISFDRIQISILNENKRRYSARGGYANQTYITWENTESISMSFSEGVISKEGLSIISNSKLLTRKTPDLLIPYSEVVTAEKRENYHYLLLKNEPKKNLFIKKDGKKFTNFVFQSSKEIILLDGEEGDYAVYYDYLYNGDSELFTIGERSIYGFLSLTGRARVKDDQTGKESTVLIEIPKLKLASDLTMRLGDNVLPYTYNFQVIGYPVGNRTAQHVCKFTYLDHDIDADF